MSGDKYAASKTDVIVKIVLVVFISLLSFSIGTFVGKKFSDNQHKVAQLEPTAEGAVAEATEAEGTGEKADAKENREVASVNPEETHGKPKEVLNDEEMKKLANEFLAEDEGNKKDLTKKGEAAPTHAGNTAEEAPAHMPGGHAEAHAAAAPAHKADVHAEAHAGATAAAARIVAGKPPEAELPAEKKTAESARIPQSLPKELATAAIGKYTVQVSSYPTEAEAEKMAADLKAKGFSAFYVAAKIKDKATNEEKSWYRVSVGVFATQKEADAYKADLLSRAKVASAIVQKITK